MIKFRFSALLRCTFISIPPPLAWVVIGLLKGDFYACAMWPDNPSKQRIENECPQLTFTNMTLFDLSNIILPACVALDKDHTVDIADCSSIMVRNLRWGQSHRKERAYTEILYHYDKHRGIKFDTFLFPKKMSRRLSISESKMMIGPIYLTQSPTR